MGWTMPSETAEHERIWMSFPRPSDSLEVDGDPSGAYETWTAVAHAILPFEPVTMIVDPAEEARARRMLDPAIEIVVAETDDAWLRDSGPSFVVGDDGELGAVDWIFNGWGAQATSWEADNRLAAIIADLSGAERVPSLLVNEGGAIPVDGRGTVLLTETVQLDAGRNPYADKARVEAELARTIGAKHAVWLRRGLSRDYEPLGTRGHVDMLATIPTAGTVLVHDQLDPSHPDFEVSRELRASFEAAHDAEGNAWRIVGLPAPATLRDELGFVDWSYVNHLVVNGGVIACGYGEAEADERAAAILADAYPGRAVVTVDAREILARGGGIHCITQQQPKLS